MTISTKQAWARGGLVFGGTMMLIVGVFHIFAGIAAIAKDQFFVKGANYAYSIDTTAWGWIHLGLGILAVGAGLYLFTGSTVARFIGIVLASLSAIANFFFTPYYPVWSLLIIALDVFVIWSLATVRVGAPELMSDEYYAARAGTYGGQAMAGETMRTGAGERWPAENVPGGRHWAPENVKEGAGMEQGGESAEAARERAAAAGRRTEPPQNR